VKITFVLPFYTEIPLGGFKVVYEYANHLVRKGHEVTIVCPQQLRGSPSYLSRFALVYRLLSFHAGLARKRSTKWFPLDDNVKLIETPDLDARYVPNADAIFATAWQTASCVNGYPREKGSKFYLVQDFPPWLGEKSVLEKTWRMPLKKVAISNWLAELILQAGVPKEDIEVIPDAIDHERFRVMNSIAGRAKRVIMLYSPKAYKRSAWGVSALLEGKDVVPDLEACFFGPGRRRPSLPSWIEYYGNISEGDLDKLYNSASIYLCSSVAEGFALPPAEAMACGCAVATTDCGGNREYAEHEKTALVSDPDDFTSLVKNLRRLLSDDELREKIARVGGERVRKLTWEKNTEKFVEFITTNM